ncbi:putative tubulin-tyrosine ligase family protein [Blattamonas nauphoetae]|uniref:Tubulin--tyrosine ligase-like protein 9 n=1 Tax=Blattamonas nauphoetae TaxID=2049346 RepID=A0ABQ9XGL1_9EUKA|nr:putative tubulin-tyrosine ligase family protein [Blattamonas nauphoetae]
MKDCDEGPLNPRPLVVLPTQTEKQEEANAQIEHHSRPDTNDDAKREERMVDDEAKPEVDEIGEDVSIEKAAFEMVGDQVEHTEPDEHIANSGKIEEKEPDTICFEKESLRECSDPQQTERNTPAVEGHTSPKEGHTNERTTKGADHWPIIAHPEPSKQHERAPSPGISPLPIIQTVSPSLPPQTPSPLQSRRSSLPSPPPSLQPTSIPSFSPPPFPFVPRSFESMASLFPTSSSSLPPSSVMTFLPPHSYAQSFLLHLLSLPPPSPLSPAILFVPKTTSFIANASSSSPSLVLSARVLHLSSGKGDLQPVFISACQILSQRAEKNAGILARWKMAREKQRKEMDESGTSSDSLSSSFADADALLADLVLPFVLVDGDADVSVSSWTGSVPRFGFDVWWSWARDYLPSSGECEGTSGVTVGFASEKKGRGGNQSTSEQVSVKSLSRLVCSSTLCPPPPPLLCQFINHFPDARELTRKDRLVRLARKHKKLDALIPTTFILPTEFKMFLSHFSSEPLPTAESSFASFLNEMHHKSSLPPSSHVAYKTAVRTGRAAASELRVQEMMGEMWMYKPSALSRGRGICLISHPLQLPLHSSGIVQRFVASPLLCAGFKFDLRMYALLIRKDASAPLECLVYRDGFVRLCTSPYSLQPPPTDDSSKHSSPALNPNTTPLLPSLPPPLTSVWFRQTHLTNSSIQSSFDLPSNFPRDPRGDGHSKLSLLSFASMLPTLGLSFFSPDNTEHPVTASFSDLWREIVASLTTLFSSSSSLLTTPNTFELFGVDLLLDESLLAWVVEVNSSPSLKIESDLDSVVKGELVADVLAALPQFNINRRDLVRILSGEREGIGVKTKKDFDDYAKRCIQELPPKGADLSKWEVLQL